MGLAAPETEEERAKAALVDQGYDAGWAGAIEAAAKAAEDYFPSIIRCQKTGDVEHVRMHVESQWCAAIARQIRTLA